LKEVGRRVARSGVATKAGARCRRMRKWNAESDSIPQAAEGEEELLGHKNSKKEKEPALLGRVDEETGWKRKRDSGAGATSFSAARRAPEAELVMKKPDWGCLSFVIMSDVKRKG